MPFDSNGVFSLTPGYLAVTGETILPTNHNPPLEDIAAQGLSAVLVRDGRAPMIGNLNMGNFKLINVLPGTTTTDGVNKAQMDAAVTSGALVGVQLKGYLYGLTLSNNAVDATNDIDIATGAAAADTSSFSLMQLNSPLTKRLDAAWAVGTGNGGLDTGSIANTTYHVWLIQRSDTGVVDALFSASATSPTLPTNYDRKRRIGSIMRVSAAIVGFTQNGDDFYLNGNAATDRNSTAATTNTLLTLSVPTGIRVSPWISDALAANAASNIVTYVGNGDVATADIRINQAGVQATMVGSIVRGVLTNTSAQIRFTQQNSSGTSAAHTTTTFGWTDTRGRI